VSGGVGTVKCANVYFIFQISGEVRQRGRMDMVTFVKKLMATSGVRPLDVVVQPSPFSVKESIDRLENFLKQQGVTVYARINQQQELDKVGLIIRPLEYLLFGNPRAGGPVMQENPVAAIALPLKVIAWEDANRKVWLGYYSGDGVATDFGLSAKVAGPLHIGGLIDKVFRAP